MFCPEGYVTLLEVYHSLYLSAERELANIEPRVNLLPTIRSDLTEEELEDAISAEYETNNVYFKHYDDTSAYADWLFAAFLVIFGSDIRITLSTGNLVRIAPAYFYPDFDLGDSMEALFSSAENKKNEEPKFPFPSFPASSVERMKAADYTLHYMHRYQMTFMEANPPPDGFPDTNAALGGLPLCINESLLPVDEKLLMATIQKRIFSLTEEGSDPKKSKRISQQIIEAFAGGIVMKRDAAKRHYGRGMKTDEWRATWKEVADAVPAASKPGPKPKPTNS